MESMVPYSISCVFMGILFAYSASVQLNDPDWYFWFPLYSLASVANMMSAIHINRSASYNHMVVIALWGGLALFVKVVIEACFFETKTKTLHWKEILSVDMERRVVREKLGSGLVVISMCLLHNRSQTSHATSQKVRTSIGFGMIVLVLVSSALCVAFLLSPKKI